MASDLSGAQPGADVAELAQPGDCYPAPGGAAMALEIRPNCELCDIDLPPASIEARICSYECTFCEACVRERLRNVCPNCGGGFVPRPIRPATEWRPGLSVAKRPPSSTRVHLSQGLEAIAEFSRRLEGIAPQER
jgi:hypothetical protein